MFEPIRRGCCIKVTCWLVLKTISIWWENRNQEIQEGKHIKKHPEHYIRVLANELDKVAQNVSSKLTHIVRLLDILEKSSDRLIWAFSQARINPSTVNLP